MLEATAEKREVHQGAKAMFNVQEVHTFYGDILRIKHTF